jgi:hypothetical protein
MDALRKIDIERTRETTSAERLAAVIDVVNTGIRMRCAALRARSPSETEVDLDAALRQWLRSDESTDP